MWIINNSSLFENPKLTGWILYYRPERSRLCLLNEYIPNDSILNHIITVLERNSIPACINGAPPNTVELSLEAQLYLRLRFSGDINCLLLK